jgi:hypothetical protein
MARRLYKVGALVEARNTKYERGKGIILTGPHDEKNYWTDNIVENFTVHWFDRPGIVDSWVWNNKGTRNFKMTKNQIKILRASK